MAALLAFAAPAALDAQMSTADAALWGGGGATAVADGFGAVSANPARLALPGQPAWSLAIPSGLLRQGLDPITLGDLDSFSGRNVPRETREAWLADIVASGGESGGGRVELSELALQKGRFGLQITTVGLANLDLAPGAAELLLFGNAGRDGAPRELDLEGTVLDLQVLTTVGVAGAAGVPWIGDSVAGGALAVGATAKITVGHALVSLRDRGSLVTRDPVEVRLLIPVVQSDSSFSDPELKNGTGFGLDVAAAWQGERLSLAAVLYDAFHTFGWDVDRFFFRPGEGFFNRDETSSDFDARPIAEAPEALRRRVEELRFEPRLTLGTAYRPRPGVVIAGEVSRGFGRGIRLGPRTSAGAGVHWRATDWAELRGGGALVSDGYQIGGAAVLRWGPARFAGSLLYLGGDAAGSLTAAGLSFSGGPGS